MNRKEIIENLKLQFKKLMFADASTQLTTNDGKNLIVMGSDAEVGLEIYLLNPDNTQTALDNGDYVLTDGRTITVADGKIAEVKAPDAAETSNDSPEETMAEDAAPADTEETTDDSATDEEVLNRIAALEEAVNQILEMMQGAMSKTEQTMSAQKSLTERFEKFAEQPSADKIEVKPKINSGKTAKDIMLEEILEMKDKKRRF